MASKYLTAASFIVYDGDVALASDLNSVTSAVEAGFDIVLQDFASISTELSNAVSYATEWANATEDTLISAAAGGDQIDDYSALHHAAKANANRLLTNADVVLTHADAAATAADKIATNADAVATAADRVQTGLDAAATAADRIATNADAVATAADRVQTGLDAAATAADRIATNADAAATALDKIATNADAAQTALDVISTNADAVATAADRVKTGLDAAAAALSETNAAASAASIPAVGDGLAEVPTGQDLKDTYDVAFVPPVNPTLTLDFSKQKYKMYAGAGGLADFAFLDKITCVRATANETYWDAKGVLQTAAANTPIVAYDPDTGECLGLQSYKQSTNLVRFSHRLDISHELTISGLSGAFIDGEPLTCTGGGEGTYVDEFSTATTVFVSNDNAGTFSGTLTGSASGATATITASTATGCWGVRVNCTVAPSATVDVEGGTNSFTITATADGLVAFGTVVTGTSGLPYTAASFVRRVSGSGSFEMRVGDNTLQPTIPLTPEAKRVTRTDTPTTTTVRLYFFASVAFAGDQIEVFFPTLEQRDSATPPIKTEASQVTRAASVYSMTGSNFSDWYRQDQGTFVARWRAAASTGQRIWSASDGTMSEYVEGIFTSGGGSGAGFGYVIDGGVAQASIPATTTPIANQEYGLAFSYKANNFKASRDGDTVATDTSGTIPTVDRLYIGSNYTGASQLDGWIDSIEYCPALIETDMWSR